jgi:hypothetical protein
VDAVAFGQPGQRMAARQSPRIPFFFQKNGDFSVLDQSEIHASGEARATDNYININHLLPTTMFLVGGNMVA